MSGVVVLGDALLDILVAPVQPVVAGGDVPATIRMGPGGQGANVAVRLARRGADVTLECGLADDPAGAFIRAALEAEGIGLAAVDVERSGTVVVLLAPDADRSMLSHRPDLAGALAASPHAGDDAAWWVVSGYVLLEAGGADLAARVAGRETRRAILGCSLRPHQASAWAAAATAAEPTLMVLNRDEATTIVGGPPSPIAVAERFGCLAVVTGRDGAEAAVPGGAPSVTVPSVPAEAVDATGAGDAFAAALIHRLSAAAWPPDAPDLTAALVDAAALAAAVTGVYGAQGRVAGEGGSDRIGAADSGAASGTLPA